MACDPLMSCPYEATVWKFLRQGRREHLSGAPVGTGKGADVKRYHNFVCVHRDTSHLVYEVTRVPQVSFSLGSQDAMKIPREADFVDLR